MRTRLVVSSSSRDRTVFPEPSEYEAVFPSAFRNVNSVSLVAASLPQADKVISSRRDTIYVSVNNGPVTAVVVDHGSPADTTALCFMLQTALQTAFPTETFVVYPNNSKVRIMLPVSFAITEKGDPGLYRTLGLSIGDNFSFVDTNTGQFVVDAAYEPNLSKDAVSILSIAGMEATTSNGTVADRTFAVLPNTHMHKSLPVCYYPVRPIAKVPKMKISWTRADGTPCDFQGQENFLHFDVDHGIKTDTPTDVLVEVISKDE